MSEISTAEDFLQYHYQISYFYDAKTGQMVCFASDVQKAMIEFAKLHVKEALRCAGEDARCDWYDHDEISNEKLYRVEKDTILDAYPLTNIK
jgi:hypothetical protein